MKIKRSSKCSLKFANEQKRETLRNILCEYAKVVNHFIDLFWLSCPARCQLLKPIVNSPTTWLSARLRKVAAREAIGMVKASRERDGKKARKPKHRGKSMSVSSTIAELQPAKHAREFDAWLHLASIGEKISLDLPIRFHDQFNRLSQRGVRLNSYVITDRCVQFCFEIETGLKQAINKCVGIDTGINSLATLSTGERLGTDIRERIERVKRCRHGSKGQQKAARALRQRMDEVARDVTDNASLVVVEKLKGITKGTRLKRRLSKNIRRSIGSWNVRYWLSRLQQDCEDKNVSFRSVSPWRTSQTCSACGYADRRNRSGEVFRCQRCNHADNADVNAARNILDRFLTGAYGTCCKPKKSANVH